MLKVILRRAAGYRDIVLFVAAGVGAAGYVVLTPPTASSDVYAWLSPLVALPGDYPTYLWRFLVSFVLLGWLPLSAALLCGYRPRDLGITRPRRFAPWWVWALLAALSVIIAWSGAYDARTSSFYPYSKTLVEDVARWGMGPFCIHTVLYCLLYYVPWEILFRGILLFPLVRLAGSRERSALLCLACLQAIPSALLHPGHPAVESVGAVIYGVVSGYVALMSGSVLPGLAYHAGIGVLQDLLIVLRSLGKLP